jgi:hypothetical protein
MRAQELSTDIVLNADLPGVLAEIAAATTRATAFKVAASVGGTRVYIPTRPATDHWLSTLVGHERAMAIGSALAPAQGGLDILVPMGPLAQKLSRWRRMKEMIDSNMPKREIARAIGCHERTVQYHRNKALKRVTFALSQLSLFD